MCTPYMTLKKTVRKIGCKKSWAQKALFCPQDFAWKFFPLVIFGITHDRLGKTGTTLRLFIAPLVEQCTSDTET